MFLETKKRSFNKAIGWRIIAVCNSYMILISCVTDDPLLNSILMNVTGAFLYYIYERLWNKSTKGRYKQYDD